MGPSDEVRAHEAREVRRAMLRAGTLAHRPDCGPLMFCDCAAPDPGAALTTDPSEGA